MPRDRLPGCRRDRWRCSWLTLLVEVGEALSRRAGIHAQRGEEFGRRVGARQIKQGTEHGPQAGPAVLAGVMNAREDGLRSEEHTSELQSLRHLVCRLLL